MTIRDDNRLADAPMMSIECKRCAATVLVRKSSWQQTSIQWSAEAVEACPERRAAEIISNLGPRGVFLACSALKESIGDAVRRGEVTLVDETVSVPSS